MKDSELPKNIFKGLQMPDLHVFKAPEINWDDLHLNSYQSEILEELKKSNEQLILANGRLINTLDDQHHTNLKLQASNGRISIANLFLAALAIGTSIFGIIRSTNTDATLHLLRQQDEIQSLQEKNENLDMNILNLRNEIESLKSDSAK